MCVREGNESVYVHIMSVCTARSQEARKEIKRLEGGRKGKGVRESIATK